MRSSQVAAASVGGADAPGAGEGGASAARVASRCRELAAQLRDQKLRFEAALDNMAQGLCFFDGAQRLIVCNRRYAELYGLEPKHVLPGTSLQAIVDQRFAVGSFPAMTQDEYLVWRRSIAVSDSASDSVVELRDGRVLAIHHQPMPDGGWVATHEDITARSAAEERIAYMARHDALTGLPNRVLLRDRMEDALALAGRGAPCAVLCLDLDHFKDVNDTLGHPTGDALLREVAGRMAALVRETDTIGRLGGDEFAIVQCGMERPDDATILAQRLIQNLAAPFEALGHHVQIGASIGIAVAPGDGDDPDTLLKNADMALYRAKADGRGRYRFFEAAMDARMQARRALELDLRAAIAGDQFRLYYQPQVTLATGVVSGFEALLRWQHPERGLVTPGTFIPLAEETGLIVPIGEWVLMQACADAAGWPGDLRVGVNLSVAQFKSETLVGAVESALRRSGLPPARLELEITESVMVEDATAAVRLLHRLRGLGVAIAMDDFGTGYSSLSFLRSFPFDKIKIDQSFVREIGSRADCMAIIRAVVGLCDTLGMATTAEGVETETQRDGLSAEGCAEGQGYLFSRPVPAEAVHALLASYA